MCWSTKAAISLKRVKIEENLLWRAYRKSQTLFRTVPFPTPTASYSPRLGVRNPPKTPIAIIRTTTSQTAYGLQIRPVHSHFTVSFRTKSPLKILEKRELGRIQGLPIFWLPLIISGTGKATNFKLCMHPSPPFSYRTLPFAFPPLPVLRSRPLKYN